MSAAPSLRIADSAGRIAGTYDLGDDAQVTGPPARGEQGCVWRLTTSRGTFAVKELLRTWTEAEVGAAALYQDAVTAAGVCAPAIHRTLYGTVLSDLDGAPGTVRVYDWIDLCDPDPMLDPVEVGRTVAAIHRVRRRADGPVDSWYTEPVGGARWNVLRDEAAARRAPFADALAEMRDDMVAMESLLTAPTDLQACHSDLWADNLRSTPDGRPCVIDWENCGPADPAQELCLVLYEFGGIDPVRTGSLYASYVEVGGPARVDRPTQFSMLIAQLMHICERAVELWLEPGASDDQRKHYAAIFAEFVDRPLNLEVITQILDSLAS